LVDVFGGKDLNALIIDPYSGRADLKAKIIKATGTGSFKEDPLRILRAFSFSCMLGFSLDKENSALGQKRKK